MPFQNLKVSLYYGRHHALQTKDSEETGSDLKASSRRASFHSARGAMQAVNGEKQLTALPSCKVCESQ